MKTCKHLYNDITSFENLLSAAQKAQRGKRFKESTARFNLNLEKELFALQRDLQAQTYSHGRYRDFIVYDSKKRLISASPYRDRVVHHALCNIIEPIFDRTFIHDSYACRKGKGMHAAIDRYTGFCRKNRYVLRCDIRKYFQSIDHAILVEMLSRKILCSDTMWLIKEIIASRDDQSVVTYFPGDDLLTPLARRRGLPIGNLTSQFFANLYLNGFDHYIKEELRCRYYIRYVDDFVVFGNSKEDLHDVRRKLESYLQSLRLRMHAKKSRIHRVSEGILFLGFRIFPTHRLLRRDNVLRMRRKLKRLSEEYHAGSMALEKVTKSVESWVSHASHADTYRLRSRVLGSVLFQRGDVDGAARRFVEQ